MIYTGQFKAWRSSRIEHLRRGFSFLLQRIEGFGDLEDIIHNDEEFKAEIIETLVEKANKL